MKKINDLCMLVSVKGLMFKSKVKETITLNKKGISSLVEVAGILSIVVACIILVLPQARSAVSSIWQSVTTNAKTFFNSSTRG